MKITKEFTKLEKSSVKLTVTVSKADVADTYKSVVAKYVKNAQIPGFRKGHVPANILERKYGEALKADTMSEVIDRSFGEIFGDKDAENRPLPYAQPQMDALPEFDLSKDLTYTVTYDVFPTVENIKFDGVNVKEPQVTIGEAELNDELKNIQERNAMVVDKKDGEKAAKDDIVTVDFFEIGDDGKEVAGSKREDFTFTIGTGENIYKIDDEVVGMAKGETKEVSKTYAADDNNSELAGTTKKLSVTVKALKVRDLPALDDDLAQDVNEKYKTLDDLKKDLSKNMEVAMNRKINEVKQNSLLEQLVEKNTIDIPASMLAAELDSRWNMMAQQFQTTPAELERMIVASGQTKEGMLEQWAAESEKMLKSRLIVDALLKEKNISVTPEEIDAEYAKIADEGGMTVEEVKKHYEDPRSKEYLIDMVKENKLFDELYKQVKVSKGDKMSFKELFEAR